MNEAFKSHLPSPIVKVLVEDRPVSDEERRPRTEKLVALAFAFAVLTAVCWIYWRGIPGGTDYVIGAAIACCLLVGANWVAIRVDNMRSAEHESGDTDFGPWELVEIFALVLLGPTWAVLASVPASVYVGGLDWRRTIWDVSICAIRVHVGALVFQFYSGPLLEVEVPPSFGLFVAVLGAGVAIMGADMATLFAAIRVRYGSSLAKIYLDELHPFVGFQILHLFIAALAMLLLARNNLVGAAVLVLAGGMATLLAYNMQKRRRENKKLRKKLNSLEQRSATEASAFARLILGRIGQDDFAARHAAATAVYASDLARKLKFDEENARRVWLAGLLHNIGLFDHHSLRYAWAEMEQEQGHPARGAAVLAEIPGYKEIARWVLAHHERVDGNGLNGLPGQWIDTEAQLISVAQAYAAAVLDRGGTDDERGEDPKHALRNLLLEKGSAYEERIVKAFSLMLRHADREYRLGQGERFEFPQSPIDDLASISSVEELHPAQIEAVPEQTAEEVEAHDAGGDRVRLIGWPTLGSDVAPDAGGDPELLPDHNVPESDGQ